MKNSGKTMPPTGSQVDYGIYAGSADMEATSTDAPTSDFLLGGSIDGSGDDGTKSSENRGAVNIMLMSISGTVEVTSTGDIDMILSALKEFTPADDADNVTFRHRLEIVVYDAERNVYSLLYGEGYIRAGGNVYTSADEGTALESLLTKLGFEF